MAAPGHPRSPARHRPHPRPALVLPCLAYFELVQPRVGEGPLEDSRPPRFANKIGVVFLGGAAIALAFGFTILGWALALLVAGLALGAAATGIWAGCEMYKVLARVRGIEFCATCVTTESPDPIPVAAWGVVRRSGGLRPAKTAAQVPTGE